MTGNTAKASSELIFDYALIDAQARAIGDYGQGFG